MGDIMKKEERKIERLKEAEIAFENYKKEKIKIIEKEYLYYHKLGNIEEAQKVVQKAIKWAEETQQMYYRQKWVERIVTLPEDTSLSIEQRLKEKKRQRHPYNITSTRKPRRPRIKYEPKNTSK